MFLKHVDRTTVWPEEFCNFPQFLQANAETLPLNRVQSCPSKSLDTSDYIFARHSVSRVVAGIKEQSHCNPCMS
jgi:hypothetical protein